MGLERFIEEQEYYYNTALKEIKNGKKVSHWIWFIFPQLKGLGFSYESYYFGIDDKNEGIEYYNNPYLRNNLIEITEALLNITKDNIIDIVGYPDNLKIKSSMTLFYNVSNNPLFKKVLDKYYNGEFDNKTLEMLK